MSFQVESSNIRLLLSSRSSIKIPGYQRDFSWELKNIKVFFFDIINQITISKNTIKPTIYFLGNMIFDGEKNEDHIEVIDGQQRLTTITIFLSALRDKLYETDIAEAKDFADTIQNNYIVRTIDGKKIIKLVPRFTSNFFF